MTTYIFGAGASVHAGYPLTKALWPRLVAYAHSEIASSTMLRAIETIRALYGPVSDIEATLTALDRGDAGFQRSEEHTSELQSHLNLVCRLLLEKKKLVC